MEILKGGVSWINVVRPMKDDLEWLKDKFRIHHLILDELKGPSARARVEVHKDYLYFIYSFPVYDAKDGVSRRGEIDFVITKDAVITVTYEKLEVIEGLRKMSPRNHALSSSLLIIHKIMEALLAFQQRQLIHIGEKVDKVSHELFRDRERERERVLLKKISYLKRDISQYRLIIKPQRHILESFFASGCSFLGPSCQIYLNDLIGEHLKIVDQLEDYRNAIEDFEATNNQLIGLKNSQVVKTFTIMAFLTFPMMLFAAIFSMNTTYTPIVDEPHGFWLIIGVMLISILGMFSYFRAKDWL